MGRRIDAERSRLEHEQAHVGRDRASADEERGLVEGQIAAQTADVTRAQAVLQVRPPFGPLICSRS